MRYLIPIAAPDDMFPRNEFHYPKPMIEVDGIAMISRCVAKIRADDPDASFVFVVRKQDCDEFSLDRALRLDTDGRCVVVPLDKPTKGAACSALMAIEHIDDDEPLVVCNGDQVIEADTHALVQRFEERGFDAAVITFPSVHPRWSYVRTGPDGTVLEAAEKRVLSRMAIAGFYYFRRGSDFTRATMASIRSGASVSGQYYIAPAINQIILEGGLVGYAEVDEDAYQSFYSPQRVEYYQRHIQARRAEGRADAGPLQILIPMAGLGSRFVQAGYTKPKPFIDVAGKAMIERVMENLDVTGAQFVLIARGEHLDAEPGFVHLLENHGHTTVIPIDLTTEGAACTVLTARAALRPDAPLLIANCDQIVDFSCADFVRDAVQRRLDGSILVFHDKHLDPKWSFARLGENDLVAEVQEKKPISDLATVGLYYFRRADIFINSAIDMICRNDRVNNEFYVCPVYNYAIANHTNSVLT